MNASLGATGAERRLQCGDVALHRVDVLPDERSGAGRPLPGLEAPSGSGMLRTCVRWDYLLGSWQVTVQSPRGVM
jgi:hypothetical protein